MRKVIYLFLTIFFLLATYGCSDNDNRGAEATGFRLEEIVIDGKTNQDNFVDIPPGSAITLRFSDVVDVSTIQANIVLRERNGNSVAYTYTDGGGKSLVINSPGLMAFRTYELLIQPGLRSEAGVKIFTGRTFTIETGMDLSDKFPRIPDEDLLDLVQRQTFRYFWDMGHTVSGMALERTSSGNTVTTGGTGFGIMAMIVAAERKFITRAEALQRITRIVSFLNNNCTRYHGAFAHWINGATGETIAFSQYDNGADIVETSLLFQGLLTARSYFTGNDASETTLREAITLLWEEIDWNWFRKDSENALYWHWSPSFGWQMNMKIIGWNEALICYVLAASSPTHSIEKTVYDEGWARNGGIKNGNTYLGHRLPLGEAYGGPLFFTHYSFLGINPQGLSDHYANYWEQNRNHTLINYNYCIQNPEGYRGYSADCWGLTASDGNTGYSAHSPTNDKGVITPTAALSSMPYTPDESMKALHFFYYKLGDKLWSPYGFYDAFNLSARWFAGEHLAIDQGPIIIMIENMRTGLLWDLFMSDEDVQSGLQKLGFNIE